MTTTRAAIYVRISRDPDNAETSTGRQEKLCRDFAASKEWDVADGRVYRDTDTSAYDEKAYRPALERLRADVERGEVDVLVVWRSDRLFRNLQLFLNFLDVLSKRGVTYASVTEGFDTATPAGKFALQMLGGFAEYESASTSLRLKARYRQEVEQGKPHRGGRRAFGFERDGTVREDEAAVIREVARRFLDGEALRQVAADLNRRGVQTTAGGEWRSSALSQMLRSPRVAGRRVHRGEVYDGEWAAILDDDTWHDVAAALGRNSARRTAQRRTVARHVLSALLCCALCGGPMQTKDDRRGGKLRYACVASPGSTNCGRVTIDAEATEAFVRDAVFEAIDAGALSDAAAERDAAARLREAEDALEADRAALEDLARDRYVDRTIGAEEFLAARKPLAERIAAAESEVRRLREAARTRPLPMTGDDLRAWWDAADVPERRRLLEAVLERVDVEPVRRRGYNRFDPDRLRFVWV